MCVRKAMDELGKMSGLSDIGEGQDLDKNNALIS